MSRPPPAPMKSVSSPCTAQVQGRLSPAEGEEERSAWGLDQEERLAREAVDRIREWLEGKGEGGRGATVPRLAIKFCGGCNPLLERGTVAREIRENVGPGARWVSWEEGCDLAVIISGCPTACVEEEEIGRKASASLRVLADRVPPIEEKSFPP